MTTNSKTNCQSEKRRLSRLVSLSRLSPDVRELALIMLSHFALFAFLFLGYLLFNNPLNLTAFIIIYLGSVYGNILGWILGKMLIQPYDNQASRNR
jgi:membrane protein YqaA with SNARE-associated domain